MDDSSFTNEPEDFYWVSTTDSPGNHSDIQESDQKVLYCGSEWQGFRGWYVGIHGYTSLMVCLFGAIANLLNLVVLTRKAMLSPTNAILTGLALADLLNMIEYIPFAFVFYLSKKSKKAMKTYAVALIILLHSNFAQVCHTIAIWLTLTLAIWRYIAVGQPHRSATWCTMDRAKWAIASAYIVSPILCIPICLSFSITEYNVNNNSTIGTNLTESVYVVGYSELATAHDMLLTKINFWVYSVVIKLIPCLALTVVSFHLINALVEAKRRKAALLSKRTVGRNGGENNNESSSDRTTKMLLAVLILFLITEFPQGILGLLSGVLGDQFFFNCYQALGEMMDIVALLNSAINFILYCVMSKKFRETFWQVFHMDAICTRASSTPKSNHATATTTTTV